MSRIPRLLPLVLCLPLLAQAGVLDTHERETQKRREDGYRADAPNNPGSTPRVPQGFIDEMRRRTEPQGPQDISPATRAFMAEQEEMKRRIAEQEKERERRDAIRKAEEHAAFLLDYNARVARVRAVFTEDAASATPMQPAVFDRAMAVAWPDVDVMLRVARLAQQTHPELWRLRLGFLLSAGCDDEAQASDLQYPARLASFDMTPERYCDNTRYLRGFDAMRPLLAQGSTLERALVCGLLYNWEGRSVRRYASYEFLPQLAASESEMAKAIADCRASLPEGSAFTEGLLAPLFLLGERDRRDVSQVLWWPLFSPATWEGVDLLDAGAIRAVVDRVAAENLARQPKRQDGSPVPPPASPDPLAGMTPEQVRKSLGRPDKKVQRRRVHLPAFKERNACLAWQDRGPLEAWAFAEKVKSSGGDKNYVVQWVVFNREGKACTRYEETLNLWAWKRL